MATGLMVLCVGQATKFSQFLLVKDKSYRVSIKLGERQIPLMLRGKSLPKNP